MKSGPVRKLTAAEIAALSYTAPTPKASSKDWENDYHNGKDVVQKGAEETYRKWMKDLYVECRWADHVAYEGKRPMFGCHCAVCSGTATHVTQRTPSHPCFTCGELVLRDEVHVCG